MLYVIAHCASYFQHCVQKHLRIYTKEFAHRMTHILPPKKPTHNPAPMLQPSWHRFGGRRTLVTNGQTLVCQILFDIWWGPVASKFHHNGSGSYQLNFEHAALIQNYQRVPAEDCCTLNRLLLALSQDHTNSLVIHSCKDSTCVVERSWKNHFLRGNRHGL